MKIEPIVIDPNSSQTSLICPFCSSKLKNSECSVKNEYLDIYGSGNIKPENVILAYQEAKIELKCNECHTIINIKTRYDIDKKIKVKQCLNNI